MEIYLLWEQFVWSGPSHIYYKINAFWISWVEHCLWKKGMQVDLNLYFFYQKLSTWFHQFFCLFIGHKSKETGKKERIQKLRHGQYLGCNSVNNNSSNTL